MMEYRAVLAVPIRVHAIHQTEARAVVGAEMDFESLPYFDRRLQQDVNPDVPYLAESVIPRPFEDANQILKAGVHLNWDFPSFLKRTAFRASDPTELPAVPTRWLISRFASQSSRPDRQWVVESDALQVGGSRLYDLSQTSVDVDIYSGEPPFAYVGHSDTLEAWKHRQGRLAAHCVSWKSKHGGRPLTAMGWGSPSFDVFYPNCRGVFGFHDWGGSRRHRYQVVGWYDDLNDDYWLSYLRARWGDWGLADIDGLAELDAEHKETLKRERVAALLREDLGVVVPDDAVSSEALIQADNWQRMVCCGEAQWLDDVLFDSKETLYALGNTPTEALSALMAEKVVRETRGPERERLEDSLAAMLLGDRLKSQKLDIGPKFKEFRHADAFSGSVGGTRWVVEKVDDNPTKEPPGESKPEHRPAPPLPDALFPLLNNLNEVQRTYDAAARQLDSARYQLYTDWYRYMHAAYPPPGETEEHVEVGDVITAVERGSLATVRSWTERLGEPPSAEKRGTGLAGDVAAAQDELEKALGKLNDEIQKDPQIVERFHWEVQRRPAPRFWEPAPPALVVAIPRVGASQQGGGGEHDTAAPDSDEGMLRPPLTCHKFTKPLSFTGGPDFSLDGLLAAKDMAWTLPQRSRSTDLPIFRGEWQVEVFPVASKHSVTRSTGVYDPLFIHSNYVLAENEPDLDDHPGLASPLALAKAGSMYSGSTYVHQTLDDRYRGILRRFRELQETRYTTLRDRSEKQGQTAEPSQMAIDDTPAQGSAEQTEAELDRLRANLDHARQAEAFLDDHDLLVATLSGFNAALLQRHESIQLNPADPLGFDDERGFAQRVAAALRGGFKGVSPDPHTPFLPIRSGGLRMMTLRLVDVFGRFTDLTPYDVTTALSMTVPGHGDWVRLPPRLAQPARWNFRFLQAAQNVSPTATESQSHPASSPVHGWVVPNLLDKSLDLFDAGGRRLGAVRARGVESAWDGEGLESLPLRLRQIVEWLLAADLEARPHPDGTEGSVDDVYFLDAFLEDIEEAMDNIHPDDREGQSAFSVLMGRPMAVVQLGVELELKGAPAVNNSWSALIHAVHAPPSSADDGEGVSPSQASADGFDDVQFDYRLGEYEQRNDGLVGYWQMDREGTFSEAFCVNDSVTAAIQHAQLQILRGAYDMRANSQDSTGRQWLDVKNEEWKLYDAQGRTLFESLLDEPDRAIKKQDVIQPYMREGGRVWDALVERGCLIEEVPFSRIHHYAEAARLSLSAADEMQQFVALIDPHSVVHLSSGIQPVKAIQLPGRFVRDVLNRLEMTFQTAPVLTPEDQLHLSLPKEKAFTWSWREVNRWPSVAAETPDNQSLPVTEPDRDVQEIAGPDIKAFQTAVFFPRRAVLREGQLVLSHAPSETNPSESDASSDSIDAEET